MTRWLGPVAVPAPVVEGARRVGDVVAPLFRGHAWLVAAAAAGVFPLAVGLATRSAVHQALSAAGLFFLVVGAARADVWGKAAAALAVAFAAHCVGAVLLARHFPDLSAALFPGGFEYWTQARTWIRTGVDPEYELANWVPAHLHLAAAMVPLSYLSLGLIPCLQGFHEVDLMNFYVGRLLAESGDAGVSLLVGWHPWSVLRGVGFTVLTATLGVASYQRLVGQPWGGAARLWLRLGVGVGFLLADGLAKVWLMEPVRLALAQRLLAEVTP